MMICKQWSIWERYGSIPTILDGSEDSIKSKSSKIFSQIYIFFAKPRLGANL